MDRAEAVGPRVGSGVTAEDAEARGHLYRVLSAVYLRPPTDELLRCVVAEDVLDDLCALGCEEGAAALRDIAATVDLAEHMPSLEQEYMDLFAAPTGRYVAPFEDVYRGRSVGGTHERGPLLGERAIAVRRMYREAGAVMDPGLKELPTHIGVELAFMSFLCEQEAAAGREEQREELPHPATGVATASARCRALELSFLREHMTAWFPRLADAIYAHADSPFYRGMALITETFLAQDTADLLAGRADATHPRAPAAR